MKLECVKSKFHDALSKAVRVVGKNQSLPILSTVLIDASGSSVVIRATNLDVGVSIEVPARISNKGSVAVPAGILLSVVGSLPDNGNISFELAGGNLSISSSHVSSTITSMSTDDFPIIPEVGKEYSVKIQATDIVKGIRSVFYSAANSSIKPELSSIYIYERGSDLYFVATDSFRLAERKIPVRQNKDIPTLLIPIKNAIELAHIFESHKGEVEVRITKSQIAVVSSPVYFTSRVIDGTFPDYQQIIPKEFSTEATILRDDFSNALKLSTVFSDAQRQVKIVMTPNKKKMEVYTENNATGRVASTIEGVFHGDEIAINFNQRYVADCFQSIQSESITIGCNGPHKPMVIRGAGDSSFTYLVMPMNR